VPLSVFEMIITPEMEYPIVCVSVKQAYEQNRLKLDMINMNLGASWFHSDELEDMDGTGLFQCIIFIWLRDFYLVMNLILLCCISDVWFHTCVKKIMCQ
jgi:hypothetical protein